MELAEVESLPMWKYNIGQLTVTRVNGEKIWDLSESRLFFINKKKVGDIIGNGPKIECF